MPNRDADDRVAQASLGPALAAALGRSGAAGLGSRGRYPRIGIVLAGADPVARGVPPHGWAEDRAAGGHSEIVAAAAAGRLDRQDGPRPRLDLLPVGRPFIVLAPTANWQPKVWPADRFAAAFQDLATSLIPGAAAVIVGGPGPAEQALADPLAKVLPDAIHLVGTLSLPEVAAVLERSALFIGNDSGLMHLAAAAGAPTIGLFGPTDAAIYAPAGRCATAVVGPSMDAITVQQVVEAARSLLSSSAAFSCRPN